MEGVRHMRNIILRHKKGASIDWQAVFKEYSGYADTQAHLTIWRYKPDADYLRDAAIKNADELHKDVKNPEFLFQKEVELELQKRHC